MKKNQATKPKKETKHFVDFGDSGIPIKISIKQADLQKLFSYSLKRSREELSSDFIIFLEDVIEKSEKKPAVRKSAAYAVLLKEKAAVYYCFFYAEAESMQAGLKVSKTELKEQATMKTLKLMKKIYAKIAREKGLRPFDNELSFFVTYIQDGLKILRNDKERARLFTEHLLIDNLLKHRFINRFNRAQINEHTKIMARTAELLRLI